MRYWHRGVMGLLLGTVLVMVIHGYYHARETEEARAAGSIVESQVVTPSVMTSMGKASCSGIACHGSAKLVLDESATPEARWPSSYVHWESFDPHRQAFQSLQTTWAKTILQGLAGAEGNGKALEQFRPETDQRCLACHTNPSLATAQPAGVETKALPMLRAEGVSCEACHGNASAWLSEHTTWTTPESRKSGLLKTGMMALNEAGERALACAGCHVGAPADSQRGFPVRDMTHDMIAAGHPRLYFDYPSFVKRLPPHWVEKNRDQSGAPVRGSDEKAFQWFAGQLTTTEAFVRLCSDRARRGQQGGVWPELASFHCYACHQSVDGTTTVAPRTRGELSRAGNLHWALPMPTSLAEQLLQWQQESRLAAALLEMQRGVSLSGELTSTQLQQTAELLRSYREQLGKLPATEWRKQLLMWVIADQPGTATWDWEEYSTRYAAMVHWLDCESTLTQLKPDAKTQLEKKLAELAQTLRFPANSKGVDASPGRWDRQKTIVSYRAVVEAIRQIVTADPARN